MRNRRACHPRDVPSALTCTHTQTIAGERESARAGETERKREAIGCPAHCLAGAPARAHAARDSGSRHVRALKCSAHEAVCMQLSPSRAAASCRDACPLPASAPRRPLLPDDPRVVCGKGRPTQAPACLDSWLLHCITKRGKTVASARQDCSCCSLARVGYSIWGGSPQG